MPKYTLMQHQVDGVKFLETFDGIGALLYEPGVGKTFTVMAWLDRLAARHGEVRVLVVAPLTACDTWILQVADCMDSVVKARFLQGSTVSIMGKIRKAHDWTGVPDAAIQCNHVGTSHVGSLARTAALGKVTILSISAGSISAFCDDRANTIKMLRAIRAYSPHVIVVDESHIIKGAEANISKAMYQIGQLAPHRIILTGTVNPKDMLDCYGQWRFLAPWTFSDDYGKPFTKQPLKMSLMRKKAIKPWPWGRFKNTYCNTPDAPIWMADQTFKQLDDIKVGDTVMGWTHEGGHRVLAPTEVQALHRHRADNVVEVVMESGRVIRCTKDHKWLSANHKGTSPKDLWTVVEYERDKRNRRPHAKPRRGSLSFVVEPTECPEEFREEAAWLAGLYDGEGSYNAISQSPTHNPEVCARLEWTLNRLGFDYTVQPGGGANQYIIRGGLAAYVRMLNWLPITRRTSLIRLILESQADSSKKPRMHRYRDTAKTITELPRQTVIGMTTGTGNYFAWGYASKNCTPGGYKGKGIGGFQNVQDLHDRVAERSHVVRLDDAMDLPPEKDIDIHVTLSSREKKAYVEMHDDLAALLASGELIEAPNALAKIMKLRQITAGFIRDTDSDETHIIGASKRKAMCEVATTQLAGEKRLVLFGYFKSECAMLVERLKRLEPNTTVEVITGATSGKDRLAIRQRFGDVSGNPGRIILVAQARTMSVSVNELVTAQHAIYGSYSERRNDWVQARGRFRRKGQQLPVTHWNVFVPGSIDSVMLSRHKDRGNLEKALLDHIRQAVRF